MNILMVAHKVMWVAVSFMATSYVAATWVIMPHGKGSDWVLVSLIAVGGSTIGMVFIGLSMMLARHWLRKTKWQNSRKGTKDTDRNEETESQNPDFESSFQEGYHSY
uniref:Uncharacterized protein n=1 Tax=Rhizophora mucronata TaxID=61149 RepID=A0A2P2N145_RHIMU